MRKPLLIGALAILPAVAAAQTGLDIRHAYDGQGAGEISLRTIVLDADQGVVAAEALVGAPECSGSFVGIGQLTGNVLDLRPYRKEKGAENCVITVTFDKSGTTASMAESDCSYYHGARCAFEGTLKEQR